MARPEEQAVDESSTLLADVNTKLRDIEEKQNLVKDRILLIGENLVAEKQETEEEIRELSNKIKTIEQDLSKIKLAIQRLIDNQDNLARKADLEILARQFKMFQPLEFARISDVKGLINQALNKRK